VTSPQGTESLGRLLVVVGGVLIVMGLLVSSWRALRLGSLPGDLHWSGRGWQVWLPLGTSILLSLILTLVLNLFFRRR
jgi:vacuolar-type H+-ATPase subunit I/STV1